MTSPYTYRNYCNENIHNPDSPRVAFVERIMLADLDNTRHVFRKFTSEGMDALAMAGEMDAAHGTRYVKEWLDLDREVCRVG